MRTITIAIVLVASNVYAQSSNVNAPLLTAPGQTAIDPSDADTIGTKSFLNGSDQLIQDMYDFRSDVMDRSNSINERFNALERLLRERANRASSPASQIPSETVTPPSTANASSPPPDPAQQQLPSNNQPKDPKRTPWSQATGLSNVAVLNSAVNRLSLADSLYATGELQVALKIYQQIRTTAGEDQAWVTFQIAQCHRRLGSKANADQAYRVVTGMPNSGRWGEYAKWWLSNGDSFADVEARTKTVSQSLAAMKEQINADQNQ
ncbi:MAG: hypothetical protein KDB27_04265 [Planctomycetales bacterium]|nr:hypothetical protein [Planctomycetales bacterium]